MIRLPTAGEVFNIGGTHEITILDLAHKIIAASGSKSSVELIPYEKAFGRDFEDMQRRVPDIARVGELLGWKPAIDLETTLERIKNHMVTTGQA